MTAQSLIHAPSRAVPEGMASADFEGSISVYFGSGCFWGRQHDFVSDLEEQVLRRSSQSITAVAGFAGGRSTGSGGRVCHYNEHSIDVYSGLGHAEAVELRIPSSSVESAARVFFSSFRPLTSAIYGREDVYDTGPAYRALIGLPGGMLSPLMQQVRRANVHNMSLRVGRGDDKDTFGTNCVWVLDNRALPFHQAEVCMQFRNNQTGTYPQSYHALTKALLARGRLHKTTCPRPYDCDRVGLQYE